MTLVGVYITAHAAQRFRERFKKGSTAEVELFKRLSKAKEIHFNEDKGATVHLRKKESFYYLFGEVLFVLSERPGSSLRPAKVITVRNHPKDQAWEYAR